MARSIEIPCGRYDYDPQTKRVSILKAKGVLTLQLNEEDELHLKWLNVDQNNKVEIDRFIFNNDTKFAKVKGQNRVYFLSFQTEDTKLFFYMQGNDINQDEQYCAQFNELVSSQILEDQINLPNQPQPQSQPMQQEVQAAPQINQQQIEAILKQMMKQQQHQQHISLTDVANQEFLHSILNDQDAINRLLEFLPEGQQDANKFEDNLLSPQLSQAMDQLSHALRDQDRAGVISQLGLDYSVLETEFDGVLAFFKAIIKAVEQEQKPQQ